MNTQIDISKAWGELRDANLPGGASLVTNIFGFKIFVAINASGGLTLVTRSSIKPPQFSSLEAIKVSHHSIDDGITWQTTFELVEQSFESEFISLCGELIDSTFEEPSAAEAQNAIHQAFESWLSFFKRNSQLSIESVRGLYGELSFIDSKLAHLYDWRVILDSWKGPLNGHRDFEFPHEAIEIKTLQPSGTQIQIASEHQLSGDLPMKLIVCRVLDHLGDVGGESLLQLVMKISSMLTPAENNIFTSLLRKVGYSPDNTWIQTRRFSIQEWKAFDPHNESFPRITPNSLAVGVSNVSYKLSMAAMEPYRIEIE